MNISDIISFNASTIPDSRAIISGDDGREFTWLELEIIVNKFGNALLDMGVVKGDIVAIYLPNCPEFIFAYFGATKIGAIVLPFNNVFKTGEISYIINNSGASVLIGSAEEVSQYVIKERELFPSLKNIITTGKPVDGCNEFYSLLNKSSDQLEPVNYGCNDLVALLYTSGTSGHPKGAMLTYNNLYTMGVINREILHINDEDLVYSASPFCHVVFMISVLGPFCAGAGLLMLRRFDPEKSMEIMTRYKATHVIGVPTMYLYMLQTFDAREYDFSQLRLAFCAGGPMPMPPIEKIEQKFGLSFCEQYGCTETTSIIAFNRMGHRRIGSVGKPVVGIAVKIVDEFGQKLPANEIGEILVKGPGNCKGYWNMPEATEAAFCDGWFRTGDLGKFDADGYLYIIDRLKDMIVSGGYNVYPREVEDIIYTNPYVAEVAVVGVKDPVRQEIPIAYVRLKDSHKLTEQEFINFCTERMAFYKVPRIVKFVSELPKGPTGKILKRELDTAV